MFEHSLDGNKQQLFPRLLEQDYHETLSWISLDGRKERDKAIYKWPTTILKIALFCGIKVVNLRPVVQGATSAPFEGGPQLEPEEGQKAGPDEPEQ